MQAQLSVGNVELEHCVAWRQVHILYVAYIPCVHYDAARIGIVLYGLYNLLYLVYVFAVISGPRAPLVTVDVSQVAVFIGSFVPYSHSVFLQILHVRITIEEP